MSFGTIGLSTHIRNNNFRSGLLILFYPILITAIVWAIAAIVGYGFNYSANGGASGSFVVDFANNSIIGLWPTLMTIIVLWFIVSYFFHTHMIRMMSHSHPASRDEEPELYNLLENLCISRGLQMPKLEIIETHARNAFASGINKKSYSITVTRGLLQALQKDEVEAVLAHELTHIINRDVRLLIICIIFTGMIGFAAQMVWSSIRYGRFYSGRSRGGRGSGGGIFVILAILAVLWLGYLASLLARFALSRSREYMADGGAIELTKNPEAMMRALLRIANRNKIPEATDDIALMCTANNNRFLGMFMTHPPIEERVKTIAKITGTAIPKLKPGQRANDKNRFLSPRDMDASKEGPNWLIRDRATRDDGTARRNPWS